ncbi:LrgB family protein [[Clostridium] aminophilum]|uniref:LrgB family protein n=1 Tax=[Clostridium] aminophilum TaxID=1526 RepID=UPI0033298D88
MNDLIASSATFGVVLSLIAYGFGVLVKFHFHKNWLNPLLISVVITMSVLSVTGISYDNYYKSAAYLSYLLTPATVALAIPLYVQLARLKENAVAILCGLVAGAVTSMGCILALAAVFKLSHAEYVTLLPKSITTAIGMGVTAELGGYVTITVAVIVITGILGNVSCDFVCKMFHIVDPIAKGLAIGASSHAIGTSRAMQIGELEGAMSSLAIVVSGILTVIGASFFAMLY